MGLLISKNSHGVHGSQLPNPNLSIWSYAIKLHVISDIYCVYLVREESVPKVHALFFASRVDGDDPGVDDDHDTYYEVMFFEDRVSDQRHQVESFAVVAVQLHHYHQ